MKKILAANWKMNLTNPEAQHLAQDVLSGVQTFLPSVQVVICPPYTALTTVRSVIAASGIRLGAQNMHHEPAGAFTGECSGPMLLSAGCDDVIIGHSERRHIFNETDSMIALKVKAAIREGLRPILCVGETGQERDQGLTFNIVERHVRSGLSGLSPEDDIVIAYEPVWAIGTGRTATPEQARDVHAMIRNLLKTIYPERYQMVPILYGGSVKPDNIGELLAQPDIDGALVGGASLKAESFNRLIEIAAK
ncbi:triose-phosphate isomerase [bacterium]|nr:triose-phosphate isomerase [candidate division CSSED10-310 bacterium]